jgi:hypothetical protein
MVRNKTLAWALACALAGGTAAAAQELVYPDVTEKPERNTAQAQPASPPVTLASKALSTSEIRVSWSAIPDDAGVTMEVRIGTGGWVDIGPVRLGPSCKGCAGAVYVIGVTPGETYFFRLRAPKAAKPLSNETAATAYFAQPPHCDEAGALCLHGRYRVDARYDGGTQHKGKAGAVGLTEESGYFWFFGASNIELVVKLLDGCAVNQRKWVFLTGMTSVRVVAVVTDTFTGATNTYLNEMNRPFPTIQDVDAFAGCN